MMIRFHAFIIVLTLSLLLVVAVQGWRLINRPTDGTSWEAMPSRLYISQSIPVRAQGDTTITDATLTGELLLAVNGQTVDSLAEASRVLGSLSEADTVNLEVFRPTNSDSHTLHVTKSLIPGQFLRELPLGIYVKKVLKSGPADQAGLKVGDIITAIDGKGFSGAPISNSKWGSINITVYRFLSAIGSRGGINLNVPLEAEQKLQKAAIGQVMKFNVIRQNQDTSIQIKLERYGFAFMLLWVYIISCVWVIGSGAYYVMYMRSRSPWGPLQLPIGCVLFVMAMPELGSGVWALVLDIAVLFSWLPFIYAAVHSKSKVSMPVPPLTLPIRLERYFKKLRRKSSKTVPLRVYGDPLVAPVTFLRQYRARYEIARRWITLLRILLIILVWSPVLYNMSAGSLALAGYLFCAMLLTCIYIILEGRNLVSDLRLADEAVGQEEPEVGGSVTEDTLPISAATPDEVFENGKNPRARLGEQIRELKEAAKRQQEEAHRKEEERLQEEKRVKEEEEYRREKERREEDEHRLEEERLEKTRNQIEKERQS